MLDINLLGKNIRALRKEKGLTQAEFAGELNVSFQAVSGWERGVTPPDISNLIRIADYFGTSLDELFRAPYGEPLFLGIDGGGSKTEFVLTNKNGEVVKSFRAGSSNPNDIGIDNTTALISSKIAEAFSEFPSLVSVFCGIAGLLSCEGGERLGEALSKKFPSVSFTLNTDSANLFAMDDSADMVVISGTGSVVFVKDKDSFKRLGGWGYLLDEGGSAYDIARDALRFALNEEDLHLPPSVLTNLLKERLSCDKIWNSISEIYKQGRPYIASLAQTVFDAHEKGDSSATLIIEKNAARLAELLSTGRKLYGAKAYAIAGGGIFEHFSEIMIPMINKFTDTKLVPADLPPVYGACRAAVLAYDGTVSDIFHENFKKSYRGDK